MSCEPLSTFAHPNEEALLVVEDVFGRSDVYSDADEWSRAFNRFDQQLLASVCRSLDQGLYTHVIVLPGNGQRIECRRASRLQRWFKRRPKLATRVVDGRLTG